MTTSNKMLLPLVFLILFQCSFSMTVTTALPGIIIDTCHRCEKADPNVNYTLCVASLASVPKSGQINLKKLAIASVEIAKANMTRAKSEVRKILKDETMNRYVKSCLETCRNLYSDCISTLADSIKAIKSGRYEDAKIWISSAVDAPGTCEDGFKEGSLKSPLTKDNGALFNLTAIALAVTSLL
ncbi:putative invertase inhibitor [Typha angustifolia]|uniref:putative invertase inhibitor n=1 Tax=Typha angustifolia TaxID=59011 RepID=UPI003C2EC9C5